MPAVIEHIAALPTNAKADRVAWLVRTVAAEDESLRAGGIVLCGGLMAAVPLAAEGVVVATANRLGSVEIGCE